MRPPSLPIPPIPLRLPTRRLLLIPLAPLRLPVRRLLGSLLHEAPAGTLEAGVVERPLWVASLQPPSLATGEKAATGSVRFARSGKRMVNDGRCLLEQAERAGLRPRFGCRMGICHRCTTRKTVGPVRNLLTGEISHKADEDIQICVSVPAGDVELAL